MGSQAPGTSLRPASAYPSPADEIKHCILTSSPPVQPIQNAPLANAEKRLPSIREFLQRPMSPSTSPHVPPRQYIASPGSPPLPAPTSRSTSGNTLADNFSDPQLFPDGTVAAVNAAYQPLFPSSFITIARGSKFSAIPSQGPPRRRKHTPSQTPLPHALEPVRQPFSMNSLARADPAQWFEERRREDADYWPSQRSRAQAGANEMSRGPSSQGANAAVAQTPGNKRKLSRQDSATQMAPAKRVRGPRGEGVAVTRSSPREATSSYFNTVLTDAPEPSVKAVKPAAKRAATPAHVVKRVKTSAEEPDVAYNLYEDNCPDVTTLDKGSKFIASWSGKPLNLDNDPNRGLLHAEEIRLASKLALTCARYLYLKRRFYAGRLEFARKSQLYNINAAQQQCKGQDSYGVVGADVNKTSSMWKAFSSVGWLEPSHMKPYL